MIQALKRFSFQSTVDFAAKLQQAIVLKYDQGGKKYGFDKFQGYPPAQASQEIADLTWYNQHSDHVIRTQQASMERMVAAVREGDWETISLACDQMEAVYTEVAAVIEQAEEEGYVSVFV